MGAVNRPGVGGINRPGVGNGLGNVNRAGAWNRGNIGNNVNINNNRNNFAVANGNRWNNGWHHGYWGGSHWGAGWGGAAGWGLGYGMGYRRGYWNGFYNRPWFAASAMYGMGAWALGSVFYDSGYGVYGNPYYTSGAGYYDYSQPIQVVAQNTAQVDLTADDAAPPPEVLASQSHVDVARDSFAAGNYAIAGKEIDLAIKELPTDAALHEFRALVYFATADYTKAAGALYAVLSAGPGWDWTTMSGLYSSIATYSTQLRALEKYVKDEPEAADARFVLAYHYITASNKKAAVRQLQEVVRLFPDDQLSMQLLQGLGGDDPGTRPAPAAQDPQVAGDDQPQPPDIDAAAVVGRRTARRADGTSFTLNLTADDKFTWAYERGGKKQEFGGTYSIDGAVLVLERSDKATMPGLVTMDNDGFNFKLFGAPEDDPGLDFKS